MSNDFTKPPYGPSYEHEIDVRKKVAEFIERDTAEGIEQYTRILASMIGETAFKDWPDAERLGVYLDNPPITPDGMVPMTNEVKTPDTAITAEDGTQQMMPGEVITPAIYPNWEVIAAEFPEYWNWACRDYNAVVGRYLKTGKPLPRQHVKGLGAPQPPAEESDAADLQDTGI